jgi:hypothetical protein
MHLHLWLCFHISVTLVHFSKFVLIITFLLLVFATTMAEFDAFYLVSLALWHNTLFMLSCNCICLFFFQMVMWWSASGEVQALRKCSMNICWLSVIFFFSFWFYWSLNSGLGLARQVLYHLSDIPWSFLFLILWDDSSLPFHPDCPKTNSPPASSAYWVAKISGVLYHVQLSFDIIDLGL